MAVHMNPDDLSRFDPFTILTTPYKTVHDQQITLDVLIPKSLSSVPSTGQPILLHYHGGGLVTGSSLFPDFFGRWILDIAQMRSAIIVSVDYRLLPEANARDVLDDVEDAWQWMHSSLPAYLKQETDGAVKADLTRVMVTGESAGGYLSLAIGLAHPDGIRAVTAAYPMVDMKSPWYCEKAEKTFFGAPMLPDGVIEAHVAKVRKEEEETGKRMVVSADKRLERVQLFIAMIQQGLYREYFDQKDATLFPLEQLRAGKRFPRGGVFVWHGGDDSAVPVEGSRKLEAVVKEFDPDLAFKLTVRPGDHGFDAESKPDDDWMAEGLNPLIEVWLK